jgi:hypothetical protein|tara:strand:- start:392 stop:1708 length:1317 start_codon:yes stop_codon:yes gene_type:complete
MGGGIMQMIVTGKKNKYITGNPETTHFKAIYFRHTNFAMESVPCIFNNKVSNNSDSKVKSTIQRSGDLVSGAHIEFELKRTPIQDEEYNGTYINWTNATGYAAIKEVSFEIGSQVIDTHYGEWFDVWNELTDANNSEDMMINKHTAKNIYLKSNPLNKNEHSIKCYVPLKFWFCKEYGLAFPLIALQNNKAYINVTFRNPYTLINTDNKFSNGIGQITYTQGPDLYIDYIYLDEKERRSFSTKDHQYLIDTLEYNGAVNLSTSHEINFNNPIKELIWVIRNKNVSNELDLSISNAENADAYSNTIIALDNSNDYFNYTSIQNNSQKEYLYGNEIYEPFSKAELFINGNSRFNKRNATYFRTIQPLNHHSKIPSKHIYSYSFSLSPEKHQPSGICNFSELKTVKLKLYNANEINTEILIFGLNYNLLRFKNGMAGLAYH